MIQFAEEVYDQQGRVEKVRFSAFWKARGMLRRKISSMFLLYVGWVFFNFV